MNAVVVLHPLHVPLGHFASLAFTVPTCHNIRALSKKDSCLATHQCRKES